MIPDSKLKDILEALLNRSRRNQVNWQPREKGTYSVRFPDSELILRYRSPPTEPDYLEVLVVTMRGSVAAEQGIGETHSLWPLVQEVYAEAERCVTGWDKVLSGIETALRAEGTVGLPPSAAAK